MGVLLSPQKHLAQVREDLGPKLWADYDAAFFAGKRLATEESWPSWCFAPQELTMSAIAPILGERVQHLADFYEYRGNPATADPIIIERWRKVVSLVNATHVLAAWRIGQGVYRFPRVLAESLWSTPLTGDLPSAILHALPEWCVYVELPEDANLKGRPDGLIGFFARLDWAMGSQDLLLSLDYGDRMEAQTLNLEGPGGLEVAVQRTLDELNTRAGRARYIAQPLEVLGGLINLLLYLCASNHELRPGNKAAAKLEAPARPEPRKTRHGSRFFSPDQPRLWEAGWRIGPALEAAQSRERGADGGEYSGPRAHLRRAHWHTYWTGRGREKAELRWLHPILVGAPEDAVPTVRMVGNK